ncbi:MAG: flavodoxin family protein [Anaerovoracaceae bacterium]
MKILVISGSPRKGGNTDIMVEAFVSGAKKNGNEVTVKNVGAMSINPCKDCEYCFGHDGECIQKDDMTEVIEAVDKAEMLVLATPIYWFGMSSQIKLPIDRLYARAMKGFNIKCAALLADSMSEGVFSGPIAEYKGICAYLKWEDKGIITISGMDTKGSMKTSPKLAEVTALGESL